jgi:hypothetical protein
VDIVSDAACFCVQSLNYVLLDWLTISTPTNTHNYVNNWARNCCC